MKIAAIALVILVIIGIGVGGYFFYASQNKQKKPTDIKTFEDCQAAGFLVVDTKPRECHTKSDQIFVEVYNGALLEKVIVVTEPKANQAVSSPFKLDGKAVGGWYFDEKLNARLEDDNGNVIMTKEVKALSSTKTSAFVPFVAAITFKDENVTTASGKLIIEKRNTTFKGEGTPLVIPVKFK
jgi:hypothetical protein